MYKYICIWAFCLFYALFVISSTSVCVIICSVYTCNTLRPLNICSVYTCNTLRPLNILAFRMTTCFSEAYRFNILSAFISQGHSVFFSAFGFHLLTLVLVKQSFKICQHEREITPIKNV